MCYALLKMMFLSLFIFRIFIYFFILTKPNSF